MGKETGNLPSLPRFAFLGAGRMASAMVGGLLARKAARASGPISRQ